MGLSFYLTFLGRQILDTSNADVVAHLLGVDEDAAEFESLVQEILSEDLSDAERLERDARQIIVEAQRAATFKRVGGQLRLDFGAPETKAARRRALREMRDWRARAVEVFGAAAPAEVIGQRVRMMEDVADLAAEHWTRIIRRLNDPDKFTAAQVAEAKQLSRDTAYYRRTFGSTREFLGEHIEEASFGRVENMAALVNRLDRDGVNTIVSLMTGSPLGSVGRAVEGPEDRATESMKEDFSATLQGLRFNRNTLTLSSTAHMRGLYSVAMVRLAQVLGVTHFMFYLPDEHPAAEGGVTRRELFQVRLGMIEGDGIDVATFADRVAAILERPRPDVMENARRRAARGTSGRGVEPLAADIRRALARMLVENEPVDSWPEIFRKESSKRQGLQVSWTTALGLHPGSKEIFVPIPSTLVPSARRFAREVRGARRAA